LHGKLKFNLYKGEVTSSPLKCTLLFMKNIILFLTLIITNILFSQIKSGEVIYDLQLKSTQIKKEKTEINIDSGSRKAKLIFNSKSSHYEVYKEMIRDFKNNNLVLGLLRGKGTYYTNKIFKLHKKQSIGETFIIKERYNSIDWVLTNETKKIESFTCFKATAKIPIENYKQKSIEVIEAWFAPEIPFGFGPGTFCGLPGLILELNKTTGIQYTIRATQVNLSKEKEITIKQPKKGIKVTKNEYDKIIREKMKEIMYMNK